MPRQHLRPPGLRTVALLCLLLTLSSCLTPDEAVEYVDGRAYEAIAKKRLEITGHDGTFSIEPSKERMSKTALNPESGLALEGQVVTLDLATILEVAAINSRSFQQQKESLYRAALGLLRAEEDFHLEPSGIFDGALSSSGGSESLRTGTEFGVTRMLETGGSYALSAGIDFLRFISNPTSESLSSFLNLSISLPFLRNAGREIAMENLTQADRDLLYELRSFERFKQTYGVDVITRYLRVMSQSQRILNEENNLKSLIRARKEAVRRFEEGWMRGFEVDQNRQAELRGRNRVINARQSLEASLDNLKDLLGIPVDVPVVLGDGDLKQLDKLMEVRLTLTERQLMALAFHNRLDFRNTVDAVVDRGRRVHIAEHNLLPDLTLNLNARPVSKDLRPLRYNYKDGTYSASFDLDLALDRHLESIALRASLIDLEAALRNQEDGRDGIKLAVRQAVRNLRQAQENFEIAESALELAKSRVNSTEKLRNLGRATTRDFLEAQDALVGSENDVVDAKVAFRIACLELLRDTGSLTVSPEGLDHDTSFDQLEEARSL